MGLLALCLRRGAGWDCGSQFHVRTCQPHQCEIGVFPSAVGSIPGPQDRCIFLVFRRSRIRHPPTQHNGPSCYAPFFFCASDRSARPPPRPLPSNAPTIPRPPSSQAPPFSLVPPPPPFPTETPSSLPPPPLPHTEPSQWPPPLLSRLGEPPYVAVLEPSSPRRMTEHPSIGRPNFSVTGRLAPLPTENNPTDAAPRRLGG